MKVRATFLVGLVVQFVSTQVSAADVAVRVNSPHVVGEEISFAANGVGTGTLTYTWDFGDGTKSEPGTSSSITHVYDAPGHYPVIVAVQDENGVRSDSFLQTVHRPLLERAPSSSSSIVYHRSQDLVCNVNPDNDTMTCISPRDGNVAFETQVGDHPRTLAVAPDGTIWVVNQDSATITVIDQGGDVLATLSLPRASRPFGIVVDGVRGRAYVSLQGLGQLVELDLTNGRVLRVVDVGPWATGLGLDGLGERIFVTRFISSSKSGEVTELHPEDLSVQRRFELALDPGPDTEASARGVPNYLRSIVVSPDGSQAWVPSKKDNVVRGAARDGLALTFETSVRTIVSVLDLQGNTEASSSRVDLNNRALGLSCAFSPLGDYAVIGLMGNNGVEVLDAYNRRVVAGEFELGKAPDGLVFDDAGVLYVHSFLSRSVIALDASEILASTGFAFTRLYEVEVAQEESLPADVLRGKQMFYDAADPRMSQDGYISCAVCHLDGFEDGQVWDFTDRGEGLRNTTSLLGKRGTGQGRLHWSANFDEVQDFEHDIRGPFGGMGFLSDEDFNEGTRNTTLGDEKAGQSEELDALSAYVSSLDTVNPSPHRDEDGSLTSAGWRGLALFEELGCPSCHSGSDFTDSAEGHLHDVGTLTTDSGKRLGQGLDGLDTPTLRGIWETAPYLHDGSAPTLREVLVERNEGELHGSTQALSKSEVDDLVSYLLQIDNTARGDEIEPPDETATAQPAARRGLCTWGAPARNARDLAALVALLALTLATRRRLNPQKYRGAVRTVPKCDRF